MANLRTKLAAVLGLGLGLLAIEYAYFMAFAESYFPGRYETAFGVVATTAVFVILVTMFVVTTHFASDQRFEPDALVPKLARTLSVAVVILGVECVYFAVRDAFNVPVSYEPYRVLAVTLVLAMIVVLLVALYHRFTQPRSSTN